MAYDEALAARVRDLIIEHGAPEEKRMFGGLGFLLGGNLAVCASHDGGLLVRTDGTDADELLCPGPRRADGHGRTLVAHLAARRPGGAAYRRANWGTG